MSWLLAPASLRSEPRDVSQDSDQLAALTAWLGQLGLRRLEPIFRDNHVYLDVIHTLSNADLRELGVALGDRKRLLAAIGRLSAQSALPALPINEPVVRSTAEAERRQLTVLFADMVDSTALSHAMDPEDLREVLRAFHREVSDVIQGAGGYVAKYMGDGVLAYFGYPQAQEDAAERAVRAGLALIDARRAGSSNVQNPAIRVGIATGSVVVGDILGEDLAREVNVVGETPNLAARLLAIAEPDQLIISDSTRRLVGDLFHRRSLGPQSLKGISRPVEAHEVMSDRPVVSRFEASRSGRSVDLVGRDHEVRLLNDHWDQAKAGKGQLVMLSGEAGIGKSRITDAFYERMVAEPHLRIRYQCSPQHVNTPLYPVITQLIHAAGRERGASTDTDIARLLQGSDEDSVVLIEHLLGRPLPNGSRFVGMDPEQRRQLTLKALVAQLGRLSRLRPLLLVLEDAHWIDPSTQELVGLAVAQAPALQVLILVTYRPDYNPPWGSNAVATQLALNRLTQGQVRGLLNGLAGEQPLPGEVVEHILARTDGIPLYVEEMFGALRDSGVLVEAEDGYRLARPLEGATVPASLQDSLMARLGSDDTAKLVAQVGAVIGREFRHALLEAIAGLEEASLRRGLDHLIGVGLVIARGPALEANYSFKHALVQDAAYASLLRSRRQQLHGAIVVHLEQSGDALVEEQPESLAYHCAKAGLIERAGAYWTRAGQRSLARSALVETVRTMRAAIADLTALPDEPPRWRFEIDMLEILSTALNRSEGRAALDLKPLIERMITLNKRLGDTARVINSRHALAQWHGWRAEYDRSLELAMENLRLDDPRAQAVGNFQAGWIRGWFGEAERAIEHYEGVLRVKLDWWASGLDSTYLNAFMFRGISRLFLGYPDRAAQDAEAAVDLAKRSGDPYSMAGLLWMASAFYVGRRDVDKAFAALQELTPLATENGFRFWLMQSHSVLAYIHSRRGKAAEGLAMMKQGLRALESVSPGGSAAQTMFLTWAAECFEMAGEIDGALGLVAKAMDVGERTNERWLFAELYRLRGDWLIAHQRGTLDEAEACYLKAIDFAKELKLKLLELRASMSLARLWRKEGRHTEAQRLMAPIYSWFSEGFDTVDLREAKELLDELRSLPASTSHPPREIGNDGE